LVEPFYDKMNIQIGEHFRREGESAPNFRGRHTHVDEDLPPSRIYLHNSGLIGAFAADFSRTGHSVETEAMNHFQEALASNLDSVRDCDYILAAIWGSADGAKMIDVFGYSGVKAKWSENPTVRGFVLRNGLLYVPKCRELTCGDTTIVLGQEEEYRRTIPNMDHFLRFPPKIHGLVSL
jgi:hypothetical protein